MPLSFFMKQHLIGPAKKAFLMKLALFFCLGFVTAAISGQTFSPSQNFRVGEKISYEVTFGRFRDVGHVEIEVVSQGTLAGQAAVEIRGRFRTYGVVGAAFLPVDEERITIASAESGEPLIARKIYDPEGLAEERRKDFTKIPNGQFDLLTLLYQIRRLSGSGTAILSEEDSISTITFRPERSAVVETPAGKFECDEIGIEGDGLAGLGIRRSSVFLTRDDKRLPVAFRFTTDKGEFRANAAAITEQAMKQTEPLPEPTPAATPKPTPKLTPTPEPYIPNRPLSDDLPFQIGETLEYRISAAGRPIGTIVLRVRERILSSGRDTLVLNATVTNAESGNPFFILNDSITELVDPVSLTPFRSDIKFTGGLAGFTQSVNYDPNGIAVIGGSRRIDVPVGTHSLLSFLYAMRSFNLTPGKAADSRVNDTRVAVFWKDQPLVFTLRPGSVETIELSGKRFSAQRIAITTGDADLDRLGIKVWLSPDRQRFPLRILLGIYQADFVGADKILPN